MDATKEFKEVLTMWTENLKVMRIEDNCFLLLLQKSLRILSFASVFWVPVQLLRHQQHLLLRGLMVLHHHSNYFPANQLIGNLCHYCSSNILNNISSWLHCKIAICRVGLKPFIMWSQLSMNWVTFLHNWQPWYHSKERLQ